MPIEIGSFSIGAVAGGITIKLIDHFLVKSRDREKRKMQAKQQFRSVIAQEIADIRNRRHKFKDSSHVNVLHTAMIEFHPFLNKKVQRSLTEAWKQYQDHEEYRAWTKPEEDSIMPVSPSWAKTEAIKYLENLLKFTE